MNHAVRLLLITVGLSGCGGDSSGPAMAPVSGVVTLNSKPLAGAEVYFTGDGFEGFGKTKEDGSYSLVRGAPVGKCKVYITKTPGSGEAGQGELDPIIGMDPEQMKAMNQGAAGPAKKPLLPPEFSDPKLTKLTFDVPEGGASDADFSL